MSQYIGRTLGSYRILEQIGQGGMATIFKAYQPSMDRSVAVKILPSHFTEDETFVERFTQEARTLAKLEHPHILPVHDYGEQDGITYLVMRYIDAGTLKDLITREGPLKLDKVARLMGQMGRALDYAHSQGVVHRDIKPTNVLIDPRGDAFLTDFGIAKLVAGTAQLTATGAIVGTPAYMSPEQGMAETVDHRSDIYSLGVVLYEMVTGRVPYEAETPLAVLLKHVNEPLPPPRQVKPDLPEAVERVILKAMAKSPDDRFQTVAEMIAALQRAVAGQPTEIVLPQTEVAPVAPPVTSPATVAKPHKGRPWLPIAGGAVALALALLAALLILPNLGGDGADATPTLGQALAQAATEPPPAAAAPVATAAATLTPAAVGAAPPAAAASPPGEATLPSPGWTNYTNGNFVRALARQEDYLWAGGEGGLVRWDLERGSYEKFTVADGLASNGVNDLLVDEDGALWIATDAGISFYDGETWLTFDQADGLDSDQVLTLFMDDEGALWAGAAYGGRGLNYYDGITWGPPPIPPLPLEFPSPRTFLFDEEIGLLVGLEEQGLAHFDGEAWEVLTGDDGLPGEQVFDLMLTDDALWISSGYGVVRNDRATDEVQEIPQLADLGVNVMHEAGDGSLWFAGEGGAARYDPARGDWQRFESGLRTIPSWAVTDVLEDEDGLWFATYDAGVVFYDGSTWETWATDDAIGGNDVGAIAQDGSGALWFIHGGTGLSRYDPDSDSWQTFDYNAGAVDWPSHPGVDSEGHLWIGEYGELLWYEAGTWQRFTSPELLDLSIYTVAFGPGDVKWLMTDDGLLRHDPASAHWTTFTAADHPRLGVMNVLHVSADGTVWVGTEEGLVRYDGTAWREPASGDVPTAYVSDIAEAPDGALWVVAEGGLYHLEGGRWSSVPWPGEFWIERVAVDPDGTVWVGYDGLGHYDPLGGDWELFAPDDGLVHRWVRSIHVTSEGIVWAGTEGGVSRYVPNR